MPLERTKREADWNAISHGLGFLATLAAFPFLIQVSISGSDSARVVGSVIFGTTMLFTLAASTVHRTARSPRKRRTLQIIDHMSIHLLITDGHTPSCRTALRGP